MDENKEYESLMAFYREEIHKMCMRNGGYANVSRLLGQEKSYVFAGVSKGKIDRVRKIYLKIKNLEGSKC